MVPSFHRKLWGILFLVACRRTEIGFVFFAFRRFEAFLFRVLEPLELNGAIGVLGVDDLDAMRTESVAALTPIPTRCDEIAIL